MSNSEIPSPSEGYNSSNELNARVAELNGAIHQVGEAMTDLQVQFEAGLITDHYKNPRMEHLSYLESEYKKQRDELLSQIEGTSPRQSLLRRLGNFITGRED